ncbi:transcription initiation factor TFIIIB [Ureibacillus chungkukjangi]|uniref:Transcription initiation factor TFIIIB n=1 Tax=Ureibacillus chungkukjangi TaxID=1202712 RepID=A0A318TBJ5_9BACL|nr:transcription initiation factor TFIIIB [Ureibacillus chungkukjangi]PYF01956.1 hypothetical protein BJ095_1527 [Ureibacillus chungkukjangi]
MNQPAKVTECPKCGGKELGKGKQSGYGAVHSYSTIIGVAVEHIICTECGYIIESYVKNPTKFKGTR